MRAGIDPVTGRELRLVESAADEPTAKRILRRLLSDVDEAQHARTRATLGAAFDAWMRVHEVEQSTLEGYEQYARLYIKPALGDVPVGKVTAKMLEDFYAELRRCRIRLRRSPGGGAPRGRTPRMQGRPPPSPTRQATGPWLP